ncbi:MAG TPA: chaperone NapD [Rhodocyclaceae bacterium]
MNISGIVVDARMDALPRVRATLAAMPGVQVHTFSPRGRLVVSIESADEAGTAAVFGEIQQLEGVLSAALVFSQWEPDPDGELIEG